MQERQRQDGVRHADDLDADYAGAGFGGALGWGAKPVVVAVDVCTAYLDPASPLYAGVEAARDAIAELVCGARAGGVPVVWTKVTYLPDGSDGGVFFRKVSSLSVFAAGSTDFGSFPEQVAPQGAERIYPKQYPSAFFGTTLADDLRADGVDTVVLCGFSTSGCVRASCVDAVSYGFVPLVVPEACGDRDVRPHEQAVFDMGAKYGDIVPLESALAHFASS
ncbi:MAG TPA: isochorismatase family protein [Candidatus Nanopelagicales bacterium]|nr:isochorismatase family protein [Candidatus Nanopelagicales bacterium]